MTQPHAAKPIQPREQLDFQLDSGVPRFWNGGDPYKTRFFDAMSLTFPIGERYFISSVRAYRDQITDPQLLEEVKHFTRQEAQHGMVHTQFNTLLEKQGLNVGWTQTFLDRKFKWQLKYWPKAFNLSYTAAAEHLTALMCTTFMERADVIGDFDPRMRAIYAWHSIEEVEHKAVCYDVLTQVAKVGYFTRIAGLIYFSIEYPIGNWFMVNRLLKDDGFGFIKRMGMLLKGAWWLYKPGGVFLPALGYYLSYFKPGFHPWQHQEMGHYKAWLQVFERTGDPIAASEHCAELVAQGAAA
ncbi:metal-dependent hydrolase [Aquabacterium lacunae]|uniref:Metal-dependent hydrolase n=1 Tax=Aquabacterium lacunae TaxID=2528630 RepID=A0A4Q9H0N5_9BURK|nr:metal-dependent hydrolase [Aquabacterium lacunae]TBO28375.1 metal-dependent hydrolase [Aquabacterium lacunae]